MSADREPSTEAGRALPRIWAVFIALNTAVVVVAAGAGHPPNIATLASMVLIVIVVVPYLWRIADRDEFTDPRGDDWMECGCTVDADLNAGSVCPACGHRDHGRSGCRATPELAR